MSADAWKLTLPCTRAEAEAIDAGADLGIDPPPVLMTTEDVVDDAEHWRLDAYFEGRPTPEAVATVTALVPSAAGTPPQLERLADEDWVTMSQAGLEPLSVGRFVVHTSAFPAAAPPGGRAFLIDAGQAFGTGHHETTTGCLAMLEGMAGQSFGNIVDLGTGTGLLAFAARHLWPDARVMGTDIDPIAIDVTRDNAAANHVDAIDLIVADGARDSGIADAGPFDLIIANILAGPLIAMAPEIASIAAPRATIVLAGLLTTQADAVRDAYHLAGCTVEAADMRGDWTILKLVASAQPFTGALTDDPDRASWARDL